MFYPQNIFLFLAQFRDNVCDKNYLGQYRYDFDQLENAQIDVPITDEFRITAADYNHDFHNLETPTTSGKFCVQSSVLFSFNF